jgi:hypothetical protein
MEETTQLQLELEVQLVQDHNLSLIELVYQEVIQYFQQ